MGTTHVIRGDEWLASLPKHLQLFRYLGFKAPKYMHIAPLMKMEGTSKKKLSKRDMGAAVSDYKTMGYPPETVIEYVLTLLNSNFEDWRRANPAADWTEFPFSIKKMSVSGALFDFDKLNDVSKNVISKMTADQVYDGILEWAECENTEFAALLKADADFAKSILSIGRGGNKPRKDLTTWADAPAYMGFFYDSMFGQIDTVPEKFDRNDVITALNAFAEAYSEADTQQEWFDKIKAIAEGMGYASDMKAYKADPEAFKGNVGDVSMFLRLAVTGKMNSPDMFEVMKILGRDKVVSRINKMVGDLK
jgi:glutamyl-tRNA synthetase